MGSLASELRPIAHALQPSPRVYVDANLPAGVVSFMRRSLGWDVLFVVEHDDIRRAPDESHFTRAFDLGRTLITLDRDFMDPKRFPPDLGPGVIVLSAPDERALIRLCQYVDANVLRAEAPEGLPLRGRVLALTPDVSGR